MAEPLDPAALGVASALKSLRTRAGLREERLHGTELALDTLTGLDSVRALVNAGESPERAIVRAVRAAAGSGIAAGWLRGRPGGAAGLRRGAHQDAPHAP